MGYQLGIDLGTTFTAAAVANGQPPTVIGLGNRTMQVPSVLFLQPDGTFLIGEPAERRGAVDPARVAREFKRRIGDPVPILIAGSSHSAQALTAHLLRWVVDSAAGQMGEAPRAITVAHPAVWTGFRQQLLAEAISLAGLDSARTCPEPVAAAVQYSSHTRVPPGARIAVYDFGGGTFDVCVLEKTEHGFQILGAPKGIEHLGGCDFDELVFQHVLEVLSDRMPEFDVSSPEALVGLARLRRDCVEAKEALSADVENTIPVALPGLNTSVRLTRSELEALIRPSLSRTMEVMSLALKAAGVSPSALNAIVLVGGSSRIPLVTEMLKSQFNTPIALDTHPKHDVALGAVQVFAELHPPSEEVESQVGTTRSRRDRPWRRPHLASRQPSSMASGRSPSEQTVSPRSSSTSSQLTPRTTDDRAGTPGPGEHQSSALLETLPTSPGAQGEDLDSLDRPRGQRRRTIGVAIALTGVVAIAVTGIVVLKSQPPGAQQPAPPTPLNTTALAVSLPESDRMSENQLLIPMLVDGNWDIYLADTSVGTPIRRITDDAGRDDMPVLSPRRRTVAYLHDDNSGVRSIMVTGATSGSGTRPLWRTVPEGCAGAIYRIAWNPRDEGQIAVACQDAQDRYGLFLFGIDGKLLRQYETGMARVADPAFSHDGAIIAYWASPESSFDGGEIFTIRADGSEKPRQLTRSERAGQDADPVWSPTDDRIAFRRRMPDGTTGGNYDIYTIRLDGSGLSAVVTASSDDQDPSYSPYGDHIAFKSNRANKSGSRQQEMPRTWIVDNGGKDPRPLWTAEDQGDQSAPAWTRR